MKYKVGRSNLAITIFVPYDCPNHCPFCTSKNDYIDSGSFSLENIVKSIEKIGNLKQVKDFVITGGEPFADLEKLQVILDTCKPFNKHLYINTTLPCKNKNELSLILQFIRKNYEDGKLNGLNVSRHMLIKTNYEDDMLLYLIHNTVGIPVKINSVLLGVNLEREKVLQFIDNYKDIVNVISFRGDYTKINDQNSLRTLDHPILDILFSDERFEYISSGGCLVCNNNDFWLDNIIVCLHRGYRNSMVIAGCNYIINDIIINQKGEIKLDWEDVPEDCTVDGLIEEWSKDGCDNC